VARRRYTALARLAAAALGLLIVGDAVLLAWRVAGTSATATFLSSFTALSNTFGIACFVVGGIAAWRTTADSRALTVYRAANANYLVGMSVLFSTIYGPAVLADGSVFEPPTFILHFVIPLFALLDWLLSAPGPRLAFGWLGVMVLFPLTWFAYTLVRGVVTGRYVYEFLDPALSGTTTPLVMTAVVLAEFLVVGAAVILVNRARTRGPRGGRARPPEPDRDRTGIQSETISA
jgi:hypothetical protein